MNWGPRESNIEIEYGLRPQSTASAVTISITYRCRCHVPMLPTPYRGSFVGHSMPKSHMHCCKRRHIVLSNSRILEFVRPERLSRSCGTGPPLPHPLMLKQRARHSQKQLATCTLVNQHPDWTVTRSTALHHFWHFASDVVGEKWRQSKGRCSTRERFFECTSPIAAVSSSLHSSPAPRH